MSKTSTVAPRRSTTAQPMYKTDQPVSDSSADPSGMNPYARDPGTSEMPAPSPDNK